MKGSAASSSIDHFEFLFGQVFYDGKELSISRDECLEILEKLVKDFGKVVPYPELELTSKKMKLVSYCGRRYLLSTRL
jgi:hypothetical protein